MPRMIDLQKTTYWWIPGDTGIADPKHPTVTELTAGKNISASVVQTTKVMAAASDTTKERSITDGGNAEAPTIGNYSGQLELFRSGNETTGVFATDDPLTIFTDRGLIGWIAKRTGPRYDAAPAAQQPIEVYKFMTDTPIPSGGAQDGYLKLSVPLLPQGTFSVSGTVTAGT